MMRSRCTGFLITDDIMITNNHCVPVELAAKGIKANFRYLEGVETSSEDMHECDTFIMTSVEHDFTLLWCSGSPGKKYGVVDIDTSNKEVGTPIFLIQQNCDQREAPYCKWTKKYSRCALLDKEDFEFSYECDTLDGSSGSPIFDEETGRVIGIHQGGYTRRFTNLELYNHGIKMRDIIPVIKEAYPRLLDLD